MRFEHSYSFVLYEQLTGSSMDTEMIDSKPAQFNIPETCTPCNKFTNNEPAMEQSCMSDLDACMYIRTTYLFYERASKQYWNRSEVWSWLWEWLCTNSLRYNRNSIGDDMN